MSSHSQSGPIFTQRLCSHALSITYVIYPSTYIMHNRVEGKDGQIIPPSKQALSPTTPCSHAISITQVIHPSTYLIHNPVEGKDIQIIMPSKQALSHTISLLSGIIHHIRNTPICIPHAQSNGGKERQIIPPSEQPPQLHNTLGLCLRLCSQA